MLLPPERWIFLKTIFAKPWWLLPHFLLPPHPPTCCRFLEFNYCVLLKVVEWSCRKFWRERCWIVCHPFMYIFKELWSLIWPKVIYLAVIKPKRYSCILKDTSNYFLNGFSAEISITVESHSEKKIVSLNPRLVHFKQI